MADENVRGIAADIQDVAGIIDAARSPKTVIYNAAGSDNFGSEIPFAVVPDGHKVVSLNTQIFHDQRPTPTRAESKAEMTDVDSFIRYVNQFAETPVIFAHRKNESSLMFHAILDYHEGPRKPRWGRHSAFLTLPLSEEYVTWTEHNKHPFSQYEFAEFIEENSIDLNDTATMLEVTRGLTVSKNCTFRGGTRLKDGSIELSYQEDVQGSVRNSTVSIPDLFDIEIPIFKGEEPVKIMARFRFRVNGHGELKLMYLLNKPERVVTERFYAVVERIASETNVRPFING